MTNTKPVVNIGENSPEHVAYKLMKDILVNEETKDRTRAHILDLYAECLHTTKGFRDFS